MLEIEPRTHRSLVQPSTPKPIQYLTGNNGLLTIVGDILDLSAAKRERANESLRGIEAWLRQGEGIWALGLTTLFAHGSFATRTPVRPLLGSEYDLDLVVLLDFAGLLTPEQAFQLLWDRLAQNERYRSIMTKKNRVIRLNYKDDFHLDMMVAVPSRYSSEIILVPDRELGHFVTVAPKPLSAWMNQIQDRRMLKRAMNDSIVVEPLPDPDSLATRHPWKIAFQLIKCARNVFFEGEARVFPSVVAGVLFGKDLESDRVSIDLTPTKILSALAENLPSNLLNLGQVPDLRNPAFADECVSERWIRNPGDFHKSKEFALWFRAKVKQFEKAGNLEESVTALQDLIGARATNEAVSQQNDLISRQRKIGGLGISSAGIITNSNAGLKSRPHTFHGDP